MSKLLKPLFVTLGLTLALPVLADDMGQMGNMGNMKMDKLMDSKSAMPAAKTAQGTGVIKAIDAMQGTVTLAHQPIKALNWPAMTMSFKVADAKLLEGLTVGEKVHFTVQGSEAKAVVTAIKAAK